jgi:hypothetical protein
MGVGCVMDRQSDWTSEDDNRESLLGIAGVGALRFALLFGSAAVALALILAPIADGQTRSFVGSPGVDTITTGTVQQGGRYTVRRSVLQDSPNAICVIRENGTRNGNC